MAQEPVSIFYRKELAPGEPLDSMLPLRGKRIGIGEPGSGTNQLARLLLGDVGIAEENTTLLELSTSDTIAAFASGELDAAIVVANTLSPSLQELLQDRRLELVNLRHADALARRHRFLTRIDAA